MSSWSPFAKSAYFLCVSAIFYGIMVYHHRDNIAVFPVIGATTFGVMIGFFAEAAGAAKSQALLWAAAASSICISILIAVIEITSSTFDANALLASSPNRLALLLLLFDVVWIFYARVWNKISVFK